MISVFDEIPRLTTIDEILHFCGIRKYPGNKIRCPSHDHYDENPSASKYENGVYCHACQRFFDGVALVSETFGLKPIQAARKISDHFRLNLFPDKPLTASELKKALDYKRKREKDDAVVEAFETWWEQAGYTLADYGFWLRKMIERKRPRTIDEGLSDDYVFLLHEYEHFENLWDQITDDNDRPGYVENVIVKQYGISADKYLTDLFRKRITFYKSYRQEIAKIEELRQSRNASR